MAFDMSRCPQTEDEARDWFFTGIGRSMGQSATDWEAVMSACGLPPGYGPGIVPTAAMPYFAFTQQFSGGPKGRMFLPSNTPDELGYYTRCMQYLDDAAGTYRKAKNAKQDFSKATKSGLVWAFYWVAGNEYAPVQGAEGGTTPTPVPPTTSGISAAEVQAMIDKSLEGYVSIKDTVALKMSSGLYLSFENGGPTKHGDPVILTGKSEVHDWESVELDKGERDA